MIAVPFATKSNAGSVRIDMAAMVGRFCDAIALVRCGITIKLGTPVIAAVEVLLTGFHYIGPHR
jgi:hypothetical protein